MKHHFLQLGFLYVLWWTLHFLFWDGRLSRDADVPVLIRVFTDLFNAGNSVQRRILGR